MLHLATFSALNQVESAITPIVCLVAPFGAKFDIGADRYVLAKKNRFV